VYRLCRKVSVNTTMTQEKHGDRNFDELGERFARNIYGSPKGQIRLQVLWRHLLQSLPQLTAAPCRVLDAGCGLGQMAARLVDMGHELTLCDVSDDMLEAAQRLIEELSEQSAEKTAVSPVAATLFYKAALQDMPDRCPQPFDIVLCHAVLEWLAEPEQAITALVQLVTAGGYLSLTFYNRDALIYRNLINGNLRKVKSGDYAGHRGGLTPGNPLSPTVVYSWLEQQGFEIRATAGLRVFYDFIARKTRDRLPLDDIIELEMEYSQRQPYQSLARYIHVVAQRVAVVE